MKQKHFSRFKYSEAEVTQFSLIIKCGVTVTTLSTIAQIAKYDFFV